MDASVGALGHPPAMAPKYKKELSDEGKALLFQQILPQTTNIKLILASLAAYLDLAGVLWQSAHFHIHFQTAASRFGTEALFTKHRPIQ
jgi:hypothetical protein